MVGLSPLAQVLFDNLTERVCTLTDEGHRLPRGLGWAGHRSTKVGTLGSGVGWTGFLARTGLWMVDMVRPIGDYLAEHPKQSVWEFFASAWVERDEEDTDGDS